MPTITASEAKGGQNQKDVGGGYIITRKEPGYEVACVRQVR